MFRIEKPTYSIFLRDRYFKPAGIITVYSRLEFRQVYNGVGSWQLEMDSTTQEARWMKEAFQEEQAGGTPGGYSGIIVTRNGDIVFSGITRWFEQTGEYESPQDEENITFYGICDNGLLSMRLVMPPLIGTTPQQFIAPSNQNWGVWRYPDNPDVQYRVSNVMYTTLADNISFRAPRLAGQNNRVVDRNIRELWVEKPGSIGPLSSVRGRYQNLLDKVQELSYYPGEDSWQRRNRSYRGIQFRTMQLKDPIEVYSSGPAGRINSVVTEPRQPGLTTQLKRVKLWMKEPNVRENVIFSKGMKNLGKFRYKLQAPASTFVVLGGQNNPCLTAAYRLPDGNGGTVALPDSDPRTRWFSHMAANNTKLGNLVSKYGLWETFLDRRDIQWGEVEDINSPKAYPKFVQNINNPQNNAQRNYVRMYKEWVQAMQTELNEKKELLEIEVEAINIYPTQWPKDYDIGDYVNVVIPNELDPVTKKEKVFLQQVKEITVTLTKEEGEKITTNIGTETQPNGRDLFSDLVRINQKSNFLEELR